MFDEQVTTSEDYLLSKKYSKNKFHISKKYYGQDNRRFKKMGYFKMIKLLLDNYKNRIDTLFLNGWCFHKNYPNTEFRLKYELNDINKEIYLNKLLKNLILASKKLFLKDSFPKIHKLLKS